MTLLILDLSSPQILLTKSHLCLHAKPADCLHPLLEPYISKTPHSGPNPKISSPTAHRCQGELGVGR